MGNSNEQLVEQIFLLSGLRTDLKIVVITVALVGGRLNVEVVSEVHPDEVFEFSIS